MPIHHRRPRVIALGLVVPLTVTLVSLRPAGAQPTAGPFAVGVRDYTFVDKSRPTKAHNGQPAQPTRTLPTRLWYPAKGAPGGPDVQNAKADLAHGPYPLVVFSHGFGANGPAYGFFIRQWTEAGYVVAAPTFPLTHAGTPGGPDVSDYNQQPADVSFVITKLLNKNAKPTSAIHGVIDPNEIAASGHSLGAVTTLGVTYSNGCCRDLRIKAALPFAGIELPFGDGSYQFPPVPMLYAHGTADGTLNYSNGQKIYADASPPKWFVTLIGGGHTNIFVDKWGPVLNASAIDFMDFYLKGDASGRDRLINDSQVPGVASLQFQETAATRAA